MSQAMRHRTPNRSGLLCYTSRVKSYAEPVPDEQFGWARFAAIAIDLSKLRQLRHCSALSARIEVRDFEEEKSLV